MLCSFRELNFYIIVVGFRTRLTTYSSFESCTKYIIGGILIYYFKIYYFLVGLSVINYINQFLLLINLLKQKYFCLA